MRTHHVLTHGWETHVSNAHGLKILDSSKEQLKNRKLYALCGRVYILYIQPIPCTIVYLYTNNS